MMKIKRKLSLIWAALIAVGIMACFSTPESTSRGAVSIKMAFIEGGTFWMGSDTGEKDESPKHLVTLESFNMGIYTVTQSEWQAVMGTTVRQQLNEVNRAISALTNDRSWLQSLNSVGPNIPMYYVSWYDAVEFCNKLSEIEGLTPAYTIDKTNKDPNNTNEDDKIKWTVTWNRDADGYRLPTEAEWEYAARGGKMQPDESYEYSGSDDIDEVAWYEENSRGGMHEVGKKKPNEFGLFDMSGNAGEWCWDWYGDYSEDIQSNPSGAASGRYRVFRGGDWYEKDNEARSLNRHLSIPTNRVDGRGFRVVRP